MMLLYAVTAAATDSAEATAGTPLRAHHHRGLTVFVEPIAEAPERSSREVLAFGRVLSQLWSHLPVLPVRFGTVVSDAAELDQLVAERESEWAERLAAVTGHSECIVHLPLPGRAKDEPDDAAGGTDRTGTEYLRRRAMELRRHDLETAELKALLAPYASAITTLPSVRPREARLAVLVPDEFVEAARAAVQRWAENWAGATVTGPWPPFSFCQETSA